MIFKDIILDSDGDLLFKNGDLVIDLSDERHIQDIVECFKGEWKQFPLVGVGISQYLNSPEYESKRKELKKEIEVQLKYDNCVNIDIEIKTIKDIKINCERV